MHTKLFSTKETEKENLHKFNFFNPDYRQPRIEKVYEYSFPIPLFFCFFSLLFFCFRLPLILKTRQKIAKKGKTKQRNNEKTKNIPGESFNSIKSLNSIFIPFFFFNSSFDLRMLILDNLDKHNYYLIFFLQ